MNLKKIQTTFAEEMDLGQKFNSIVWI